MVTLRFEPIATQLGKQFSPVSVFPRESLERVARPDPEDGDPAWGPELQGFMAHYTEVAAVGHMLLAAPAFGKLAELANELEDEYASGGPPMSPVYDSYSVQHLLAEVPQGLAGETPYSVLARLSSGDAARARLCEMARALAASYLDLYRVLEVESLRAQLLPLRGGEAFYVQLSGPFLRNGDVMLARVLAFGSGCFIADSPYLLAASEREWLDYLQRVPAPGESPAAPACVPARSSHAKLSPKQAARRRKQQKLHAAERAPDQAVAAHLKHGDGPRYWLEFIMDGYAGERNGIVLLAGVPDRPESLPHNALYAPAEVPPMHRVRQRLSAIAQREGMFDREQQALAATARALGVELQLHDNDKFLLTAYCTLGARSAQGATALELLRQEHELDAEERAVVHTIEQGRFTVLRIQHIQLDEGMDASDVLSRRKLHIRERSATRQVAIGDLLLGWICDEGGGDWTLEGGVVHVPSLLAEWVCEQALRLRDERRAAQPREAPEQRAVALVIPLLAQIQWLRKNPPLPALFNTHGDALQLATARYTVLDPARARAGLMESFRPLDGDRFAWLDERGTSLAELYLSDTSLIVRVNSLERREAVQARIEATLGSAVRRSLGTLDGDSGALHARVRRGQAERELPLDLSTLPPEAVQQLHGMLREQIQRNFDAPVPAFKGKTLRQLARGKSRSDAVSWLREQERILKHNPQLQGFDMRPLWQDLGLEYQGPQADP